MTRESEFCYIAELVGTFPRYMLAATNDRVWWTEDTDQAMRFTADGTVSMAERAGRSPYHKVGFRKILAG